MIALHHDCRVIWFLTRVEGMASVHFWKPLKKGDVVDIVAPSSASTEEGLQGAVKFVEGLGLEPRVPEDIFGRDRFCANSDPYRLRHLKRALYARDSRAVWCLRGGWGAARLIPHLARLKPPPSSKIFIGYSDITTLHLFFNFFWDWATVHGSMLERMGRLSQRSREFLDFHRLIFGKTDVLEYKGLLPLNDLASQKRVIQGPVVGGNLSLVQSILGTPWQVSLHGKILALEEVGERGYRVDRILVHLQQAGLFKGVRAIVLGDFLGLESASMWRYLREDFAERLPIPVLKGLPFGHGGRQRPVPFCTPSQLKLGERGELRVHSGCAGEVCES